MGLANVPWEGDYPMCPGNGTIKCALGLRLAYVCGEETSQCALGMRLANVPWEWDYPICPGNERLANVHWELDYQICPGNESIQCVLGMGLNPMCLGMGLANVPWEWDRPGKETIQCTLGMALANVPREWG